MSLRIQVSEVTGVLLSDGWRDVVPGSFDTDAYEFLDGDHLLIGGGVVEGLVSTGFTFKEIVAEREVEVCGPITQIHALRVRRKKS